MKRICLVGQIINQKLNEILKNDCKSQPQAKIKAKIICIFYNTPRMNQNEWKLRYFVEQIATMLTKKKIREADYIVISILQRWLHYSHMVRSNKLECCAMSWVYVVSERVTHFIFFFFCSSLTTIMLNLCTKPHIHTMCGDGEKQREQRKRRNKN